ncbi:DUF2845 domain-containing protein [Hahella sp. HN01]|nr:DUF2845 domain-containing protein [Hahella sp. HN01]MBU6952728.1 DUF2845 domain-containing protein [Hahella sp. HN01]
MVLSSGVKRLFLALILCSVSASSWALRCGKDLVSESDLDYEVQAKCGQPDDVSLIGYGLTDDKTREFKIERWIYLQPNKTLFILRFEAGKLVDISWKRAP